MPGSQHLTFALQIRHQTNYNHEKCNNFRPADRRIERSMDFYFTQLGNFAPEQFFVARRILRGADPVCRSVFWLTKLPR